MQRAWWVLVVALLGSTCLGCGRSVAARGTGWWRVLTDHVELETDVSRGEAVTAGWAFEDDYRALEHVFPACSAPPIGERVRVTMIARGDEYDAFAIPQTAGYFAPASVGIVPTPAAVVVRAGSGLARGYFTQIYTHELTHRFVARCFPDASSWLHEGMARYFETLRVGDDLLVGVAPYRIAGNARFMSVFRSGGLEIIQARRSAILAPSVIAAMSAGDFYALDQRSEHYASAWALVHMLMVGPDHELQTRFTAYLAGMASHGSEDDWWARNFDAAALDRAGASYLDHPLLERRVHYAAPPLRDPAAEPLAEGEAHLLWASLESGRDEGSVRLDALANLALALESPETAARARLMQLQLGAMDESWASKAAYLADVASAHPDDLAVLSTRVQFETDRHAPTNEGRALLALLSARDDIGGIDLARLADLAVVQQMPTLALVLARRAVSSAPSASPAHAALARALWQNSDGAEAARERRLAIITAGHGASEAATEQPRAWQDPPSEPPVPGPTPAPIPLPAEPDASGALLSLGADLVALTRASTLDRDCIGFVGDPIAVIEIPTDAPPLVIRTRGNDDTVLVVEDAQHHFRCDDDSGGATTAAVYGSFPAGALIVRVGGFRPSARASRYQVGVERGDRALDPTLAGVPCSIESDGARIIGARVVLREHVAVAPFDGHADPIRDSDWVPAMDAFVGQTTHVIGSMPRDAAGCAVVRVEADRGTWLWRVRDLAPAP